jgi:hypothetical protein
MLNKDSFLFRSAQKLNCKLTKRALGETRMTILVSPMKKLINSTPFKALNLVISANLTLLSKHLNQYKTAEQQRLMYQVNN